MRVKRTETEMRSLTPDRKYFEYLDEMRGELTSSTFAASLYLVQEFPNLKREEAKAVYLDWRSSRLFQSRKPAESA